MGDTRRCPARATAGKPYDGRFFTAASDPRRYNESAKEWEATLVKLCDRIDNFLDSAGRNGRYTKRYLASTDELIAKLSTRASLHGYEPALEVLVGIRNSRLEFE